MLKTLPRVIADGPLSKAIMDLLGEEIELVPGLISMADRRINRGSIPLAIPAGRIAYG